MFLLAWTTTPWTLPSNTALAVNKSVVYVAVETFNLYTNEMVVVVVAKELLSSVFSAPYVDVSDLSDDKKQVSYKVVQEFKGSELIGLRYKQLLPIASL